jgi:hypothetical protein
MAAAAAEDRRVACRFHLEMKLMRVSECDPLHERKLNETQIQPLARQSTFTL